MPCLKLAGSAQAVEAPGGGVLSHGQPRQIAPDMREALTLVGYGRFGRALADLLDAAGHDVVAVDPSVPVPDRHAPTSDRPAFRPGGVVVLSVPVVSFRDVLSALRPRLDGTDLVVDVSSVRTPVEEAMDALLGDAVPWVGTHPLFGPSSIAL
ncbi:MAG: prephenate dehydrogenase/arogenate dehydrogenase family protein, partial [Gemmatimonadetes bacterium]|nr:prephenate dehydrogenase/arogenate dehydrogenase family protein [Gemmatimonadota bacterium]